MSIVKSQFTCMISMGLAVLANYSLRKFYPVWFSNILTNGDRFRSDTGLSVGSSQVFLPNFKFWWRGGVIEILHV